MFCRFLKAITGRLSSPALAVFALLTGFTASVAHADPGEWAGKTVTLLVGQPAGGAYDGYARLLAQYLPQFLPGAPRIVVANMPGAGGLTMADFVANEAPKDGTTIGLASGAIGTADLFKFAGVRFDPRKISWIGNMDSEIGEAISWKTAAVTTQDLFKHELIVAGTGAASNSVIFPRAMNKVIGTKFKVISGYHGSGEMALALQRGEVQGIGSSNYSDIAQSHPDWISEHKVNFLLQLSVKRHPALPSVPTAMDFAQTDEKKKLLQLIFAQQTIGRPVFGPAGVPADKLQQLQHAFYSILSDPAFRQNAQAGHIQIIDPLDGPAVKRFIDSLYELSPDIRQKAVDALGSG